MELLGSVCVVVCDLLKTKTRMYKLKNDNGSAILNIYELNSIVVDVDMQFLLVTDITDELYFQISHKSHDNDYDLCYRSEIRHATGRRIMFNKIDISLQKLCKSDFEKPLLLELFKATESGNTSVGKCEVYYI